MADEELVDWIELYVDGSANYRWRAKSANGRIVAESGEGYENRVDAVEMAIGLFPGKELREE